MLPDFSFNSVPAAMNQWASVWASITKPAGGVLKELGQCPVYV